MSDEAADLFYPIATAVHLVNRHMHEDHINTSTDNLILKNIVLPYASMGRVHIANLSDEFLPKYSDDDFGKIIKKSHASGLCCDLSELISEEALMANAYSQAYDPQVAIFNQKFSNLTAQYAAAETQLEILTEDKLDNPPSDQAYVDRWLRVFDQNLALWSPSKSRIELSQVDISQLYYYIKLSRIDAYKLWMGFRRDHLSFDLESLKLRMAKAGFRGVPIHYSDSVFHNLKDKTKVVEIAFPEISVPYFDNISATIDFVKEDQFIKPIRNLRGHAKSIITGNESFDRVSDNIKEDMYELNRNIAKETKLRKVALFKIILGDSWEAVEELVQFKFGKAIKLAFEISEKLIERQYCAPEYTNNPLYFAWTLNNKLKQ